MSDDFKASVNVSRQWDGKRVGQELVDKIKQDNVDPDFILLFSTIHYEGEFQKFLDIVKDEFPDAPLVGGTVAGFMSQEGCYTRGVSAMAVEYENMDVAVGVGHNTKRNPEKAAKKCAESLKLELKDSDYENAFLIDVVSGGLVFELPFIGRKRVFRKFPGRLSNFVSRITSFLFNKGPGREEELLERLSSELSEYNILSGSAMDDNRFLKNYQFYNRGVYKTSVVGLGLKTDLDFTFRRSHGLVKTGEKFQVSKTSYDDRFIYQLNNEPALKEFLEKMNWPEEYISEEELHSKTLYYPLGFEYNDSLWIDVIALVSGDSLGMVHEVKTPEIHLLSTSGKNTIDAVEESLKEPEDGKNLLGFGYSCAIRLETLGSNAFKVQEKVWSHLNGEPFLVPYVTGEGFYKEREKLIFGNDTFNFLTFSTHEEER